MERTIFLLFLWTAVQGDIGEHIYVPKPMTWPDAQAYCRENDIDLSFVSSQNDTDRLLKAAGTNNPVGWIGLHRDPSNITAWMWSGGGHVTYQNWLDGQPDNYNDSESTGHITSDGKWNDDSETKLLPFYCISVTAVEVKMNWEDALEHCREKHADLTSLSSETERLLARKVMRRQDITARVWIGLRYLGDRWLWVNGDPLKYKAWPQGGDQDHLCPIRKRCGALTKKAWWENLDCQDKLNFICH